MKIKIYAVLKDYFPATVEINSAIANISELKAQLEKQNPSAKAILDLSRFAVDDAFVALEHGLTGTETISVIPPSSGG
ncbi:MAG TPA: MoaD/ThiS family protein [Pelobium sp.]|nr:MoaD/ThiS family protein [Pelobium sp.]